MKTHFKTEAKDNSEMANTPGSKPERLIRKCNMFIIKTSQIASAVLATMNFNHSLISFPTATPAEKEEKNMTGAIVGGVIGGLVFILVVVLGVWYCAKQKKKKSGRISPEDPALEPAPAD